MLAGSANYTNLLSPNDYEKSEKIICKYLKDKCGRRSLELKLEFKKLS